MSRLARFEVWRRVAGFGRQARVIAALGSRRELHLGGVLLAIGLCWVFGTPVRAAAPTDATTPTTARIVALPDGRRFNLACEGHGAQTIVFLQGAGSSISDWSRVRPAFEGKARTCLYDRAGYGFSDAATGPMTLRTVVKDLHDLLATARLAPPFILVGHSLGGFYATYFADRYPRDVAGLVLVDPAFAGAFEFPRSGADDAAFAAFVEQTFSFTLHCASLARAGKLTPEDRHDCFAPLPADTNDRAAVLSRLTRPALYDAELLEIEATAPVGVAAPPDVVEERAAQRRFGATPMRVLTAGAHAPLPGLSKDANRVYLDGWRRGHAALAARSTRGKVVVVDGASHFIQLDHPQAVIDAIDEVMAEHDSGVAAPR